VISVFLFFLLLLFEILVCALLFLRPWLEIYLENHIAVIDTRMSGPMDSLAILSSSFGLDLYCSKGLTCLHFGKRIGGLICAAIQDQLSGYLQF
jgi:hypothetical protein